MSVENFVSGFFVMTLYNFVYVYFAKEFAKSGDVFIFLNCRYSCTDGLRQELNKGCSDNIKT